MEREGRELREREGYYRGRPRLTRAASSRDSGWGEAWGQGRTLIMLSLQVLRGYRDGSEQGGGDQEGESQGERG